MNKYTFKCFQCLHKSKFHIIFFPPILKRLKTIVFVNIFQMNFDTFMSQYFCSCKIYITSTQGVTVDNKKKMESMNKEYNNVE